MQAHTLVSERLPYRLGRMVVMEVDGVMTGAMVTVVAEVVAGVGEMAGRLMGVLVSAGV